MVDEEVNKDPQILSRERGKAAVLMEGVVSRQSDKPHGRTKNNKTFNNKNGNGNGNEPESIYKPVGKHIDERTIESEELRKHVEKIIRQLVIEATNSDKQQESTDKPT